MNKVGCFFVVLMAIFISVCLFSIYWQLSDIEDLLRNVNNAVVST